MLDTAPAAPDAARLPTARGCVTAELAACRVGVGVAARPDLELLELRGRPVAVRSALRRLTGRRLTVGEAVRCDLAWWQLLAPHHALVVGGAQTCTLLRDRLRAAGREAPDTTVVDVTAAYAVVALAGPGAGALAGAPAVAAARPAAWLRQGAGHHLLVVPHERAAQMWRALLAAGRPLGATVVGREAVELLRAADGVVDCQRHLHEPRTVPA